MKNNKKLSMKSLQEQINKMNATKLNESKLNETKSNEVKGKTLKSSLFSFAAISIAINYFFKIPFISKLLLKFKSKFGKKWFWHILVLSRKIFIIFNALIGCYFVYKLCGFGSGSMFANIAGIGNSYLKILYSFWQGVFEFFCDLLDFKVVPKVPKNPPVNPTGFSPWNGPGWYSNPMVENKFTDIAEQSKEWFSNSSSNQYSNLNNQTPWYKDWSYLLYGAAALSIFCAGYLIISYFLSDTTVIEDVASEKVRGKRPESMPEASGSKDSGYNQDGTIKTNTKKLINLYGVVTGIKSATTTVLDIFNPLPYLKSNAYSEALHKEYLTSQCTINKNIHHYPFTSYDPMATLSEKFRHGISGETVLARSRRSMFRTYIGHLVSYNITNDISGLAGCGEIYERISNMRPITSSEILMKELLLKMTPLSELEAYANQSVETKAIEFRHSLPPTPGKEHTLPLPSFKDFLDPSPQGAAYSVPLPPESANEWVNESSKYKPLSSPIGFEFKDFDNVKPKSVITDELGRIAETKGTSMKDMLTPKLKSKPLTPESIPNKFKIPTEPNTPILPPANIPSISPLNLPIE